MTPAEPSSPALSVVIGAHGPEPALEACLESLAAQRKNGTEVLVCHAGDRAPRLRGRYPWVTFLACAGRLVPELWAEGIRRSGGSIVALTNSTMIPAEDWLARLEREHERHDVVAGAIEPAPGLRLGDWAEYFCRYTPDMLPFEAHAATARTRWRRRDAAPRSTRSVMTSGTSGDRSTAIALPARESVAACRSPRERPWWSRWARNARAPAPRACRTTGSGLCHSSTPSAERRRWTAGPPNPLR